MDSKSTSKVQMPIKVKLTTNKEGKVIKVVDEEVPKILTSLRYPNIVYFEESEPDLFIAYDKYKSRKLTIPEGRKSLAEKCFQNEKYVFENSSESIPPRRRVDDDFDYSSDPSYQLYKTDYAWYCRLRYDDVKKQYEKQFQKEVAEIIRTQPTAVQQYFTSKLFYYSTIWPPMHSQREIEIFKKKFFKLTRKQRMRLNYLMETDLT